MRYLVTLAVLCALAPATSRAQGLGLGLGLDLGGGQRVATASGILSWDRSWSADWTTGTSTPAPTIECEAAAADGDLTCTGATATKVGAPTTVPAAGYPARTAVRLSGTDQYFTLGDVGAITTQGTVCLPPFTMSTASGNLRLLGRYLEWRILKVGALLYFDVYKAGGGVSSLPTATLVAGATNHACFSYNYVADGSSVMLANVNGTAYSSTVAVGPIPDTGAGLLFGNVQAVDPPWAGDASGFTIDPTQAASAADLAALVASQQARLATKPAGALATVSSGATLCDSAGDGTFHSLPANSLCCKEAGCEIWSAAAHSNAIPNTAAAGWTGVNAAVSTSAGPDGSATSAITVTAAAAGGANTTHGGVSGSYTATSAAWTDSAYLKAGTKTWAFVTPDSGVSGAYVNIATCAIGTQIGVTAVAVVTGDWCRVATTKTLAAAGYTFRVYTANGDGLVSYVDDGTGTIHVWAPKAEVGTIAGPPVLSAGAPVTGVADVASVATTTGKDAPTVDRWARSVTVTVPDWTDTGFRILWANGAADNRAQLYQNGANIVASVYSGATAKLWTCAHGLTGSAQRTVDVVYSSGSVTLSMGVPGGAKATLSCSTSGAGTGVQASLPTATYLGSTGTLYFLNGPALCYREGKTLPPSQRCP